jgi:hypothetical protein
MNTAEIKERARHKAFAKINFIELENRTYKRDIKAGGDGRLSVDLLKRCLNSNEKELQTWQYIAKLIETDE